MIVAVVNQARRQSNPARSAFMIEAYRVPAKYSFASTMLGAVQASSDQVLSRQVGGRQLTAAQVDSGQIGGTRKLRQQRLMVVSALIHRIQFRFGTTTAQTKTAPPKLTGSRPPVPDSLALVRLC